ncbi:hypothetical protein [Roseobacter sp.]|uniref:hypothetical protein n=1 Tax=Roseobacter sp. TaxID=1907202 RepID=UPI00385A399A
MLDPNDRIATRGGKRSTAANGPSLKDRILANLVFLRSAVLSVFTVLAVIAILVIAARDLARTPIVLEEIGVPETLNKEGYNGLVASNMLWDAIEDIRHFTGDNKKNVRIQTASRQLDIVEPGSGLSLQRITQVLRSLFNLPQTRIAGEFVCLTSGCTHSELSLRIRVFSGEGTRVISAGPIEDLSMEDYFHETALHLLEEEIDPLVAARYDYFDGYEGWKANAVRISTELLLQRGPGAEEAAALLGVIALDDQDYDLAYERSVNAIEVGDDLRRRESFWSRNAAHHDSVRAQSLLLQGEALSELGYELDDGEILLEAMDVLEQAARLAPDEGFIRTVQAQTLQSLGQYDEAIDYFKQAVDVDILDPYAWSDLGRAQLDMDRSEDAEINFETARNLAPYDMYLVHYHATDHSLDKALNQAKRLATNAPDDLQTWDFWLDMLDEKLYDTNAEICDGDGGSVADLVAVASEIAPIEALQSVEFYAKDTCDWSF